MTATSNSLLSAIATLEGTEVELSNQLEATRQALTALRAVAGVTAAAPASKPGPRRRAPASRARKATRRRPDADRQTPAVPLKSGSSGQAAAQARERALLAMIGRGIAATSLLRSELPIATGITALQHKRAVSNALTRLKVDGLIARGERGGWELTSKGRRAATGAAPVKEAP